MESCSWKSSTLVRQHNFALFTLISTVNANNKHKYFHRRGGLQPGDVVVSINDKPIINTQDIYRHLEVKESQIKISVIRKREKINFLISLEDSPN